MVTVLIAAAGVVTGVVVAGRSGHAGRTAPLPLPASMAATGDSITQAFDVDSAHLLQNSPDESWATGSDPGVDSQYSRILAAAPAIAGHVFNDAQSGAKMAALGTQLAAAAAQHVVYATVLMGANDLCTSSVATMTPTATFQASFAGALSSFFQADPTAHVFVSSIPDVTQLYTVLQSNLLAQGTWALAHICQSLLSLQDTASDRAAVATQELADNEVLQMVCAHFSNCRFDGFALYRARFGAADISTVDYFHPSLAGQRMLAAVSWAAGYWPATP